MTNHPVAIQPASAAQNLTTVNFSERDFRNALAMFATGVSVVTANHAGERIAATIGSFGSVSLDPPLILFMIAKSAKAFPAWSSVRQFAVNILDRSQRKLSTKFAKALSNKWESVEPLPGSVTDAFLLPGSLAWLECETDRHYEGGDHLIIVGKVLAISHRDGSNVSPLIFFNGYYRSLMPIDRDSMPHEELMWIHGW